MNEIDTVSGAKLPNVCVMCGKALPEKQGLCQECERLVQEHILRHGYNRRYEISDEWIFECANCGKECPSVDQNGMCSSCRQVWNG